MEININNCIWSASLNGSMIFYFIVLIISFIISYIIYQKHNKKALLASNIPAYDHAIIIGGSLGGMVTAAYLSKHFKRITIIESDDVLNETLAKATSSELLDYRCRLESPTSIGRSGVSQIYQVHALEGEGLNILDELFPHFKDKLSHEYDIRRYSVKKDGKFYINGVLLNQNITKDIEWLGIDRFTLETALRRELCLQYGNQIRWKCNARVSQLLVDQAQNTVQGVTYRLKQDSGSQLFDIYGDFIIDCSGRNTSSIKWLKESFDLIVPTIQMHFGCGYVTFIGERLKTGDSNIDSSAIICCNGNVPDNNTGCYIIPMRTIESNEKNSLGTLSIIGLHCVNAEYPPNDSYEHLLEWAKEHLDNDLYSVLKATKVCSPLVPYRRAIDDRKYVELLDKDWPHNYILLGDSMCTFNPQFGQGMTHAFRHARELRKIFDEHIHELEDISCVFNRRASTISEEYWLASTANDWKSPMLKIIKIDKHGNIEIFQQGKDSEKTKYPKPKVPLLIKFLQWYNYWFLRCASKSEQLSTDFIHVVNQHYSPFILMKPTTFFQVCRMALTDYFFVPKSSSY